MTTATFLVGDVRAMLATLLPSSVDLVLTSPPFLALRSYLPADHPDKALEIGSEPDPAAFLSTMLGLTAEWRRVLTPHGSIAVELGDTYSGSGGAGGDYADDGLRAGQQRFKARNDGGQYGHHPQGGTKYNVDVRPVSGGPGWPLAKCLTLAPELYRVALAYGRHPLTGEVSPAGRWRVRNVVRWVRPNPPVGALGDKFRPATSDMVIACTSGQRWFDLEAVRTVNQPERLAGKGKGQRVRMPEGLGRNSVGRTGGDQNPAGAPPLDWWEIVPKGYDGAHYATYPPELCVKPIEAMCPRRVCRTCGTPSRREVEQSEEYKAHRLRSSEAGTDVRTMRTTLGMAHGGRGSERMGSELTTTGWSTCGCPGTGGIRLDGFHEGPGWRPGIVLDPFAGSGTTLAVAHGHGRSSIGIDLDARNLDLARERLGMFLVA